MKIGNLKKTQGFTLVELLVVLVIIGIIVAIILPNALTAIARANDKECASNIRSVQTAINLCYSDVQNYNTCNGFGPLTVIPNPNGGNNPYLDAPNPVGPTCPFGVAYVLGQPAGAGPANPVQITNIALHWAAGFPPAAGVRHVGNTN